ncbi:glycosyltransferase [Patiriisocius marinus]|uniref:Glycosyl transferase n=1 Tax=Patiriisocius marinus TaxID=1397112 RepID=A0A5J4INE3_9FLAO|nr:glycosyltransferase [Patiriisocius marinus]GER58955.1 glycosyl transferase [Patiriisocius marinus]
MQKKLLIIGHTFPEPSTTAAGQRMLQLIDVFLNKGFLIEFGSTASVSTHSADLYSKGITSEILQLNDSSFDDYIASFHPDIVLFDRFITEEQFGWRVAEQCPKAMRILDTEDLHFLRKARQDAFKKEGNLANVNLFSETAKREIASILRCDISLIISEVEVELLVNTFNISEELLCYVPFMVDEQVLDLNLPSFSEREGFMTIGNFFHAPNVDSVLFLKKDIWPKIREQLPKATLSVYGNYAPQQISELHNEKEGFLIKGWAPDVASAFIKAKVCLAPLRFGAGLKGKLLDSLIYGTPAVTTSVGAEGMYTDLDKASNIGNSVDEIVNLSVILYSEKSDWLDGQQSGFKVLKNKFSTKKISEELTTKITLVFDNLGGHRQENFIGQILLHQSLQATKYLSKWIEQKNK